MLGKELADSVLLQDVRGQTVTDDRSRFFVQLALVHDVDITERDDAYCPLSNVVDSGRLLIGFCIGHGPGDPCPADEVLEGILLSKNDKVLAVLELAGDPQIIVTAEVPPPKLLTMPVVPPAVVGDLIRTAAHLTAAESEQVAGMEKFRAVHPFHQSVSHRKNLHFR